MKNAPTSKKGYPRVKKTLSSSVFNEEEREKLVREFAPLVRFLANRIAMRVPPNVTVDDLISCGTMGLLDAITKFDPSKNVKFKTYAEVRIKGSILDGLRSLDWIPRSVRKKIQDMEKCIVQMEKDLGYTPNGGQIAKALNLDIEEYHTVLNQARSVDLLSLDEPVKDQDFTDSKESYVNFIPGDNNPLEDALFSEMKDIVADSIKNLSKKEQIVIALYYHEGLTLKEIGAVLELTESRISQIHTQCIIKLRARLKSFVSS